MECHEQGLADVKCEVSWIDQKVFWERFEQVASWFLLCQIFLKGLTLCFLWKNRRPGVNGRPRWKCLPTKHNPYLSRNFFHEVCLPKQQFHLGSIEFAGNCLRALYWCGIIKNSSPPKEREHKTGPLVTTAFSPQIVQIMWLREYWSLGDWRPVARLSVPNGHGQIPRRDA